MDPKEKFVDAAGFRGVRKSPLRGDAGFLGVRKSPLKPHRKSNPIKSPKTSSSLNPKIEPDSKPMKTEARCDMLPDSGDFTVKVSDGVETARFRLNAVSSTMEDLRKKLVDRFEYGLKSNTKIKYKDNEGDWVSVTCQEDFEELLKTVDTKKMLRMKLFC